MGRDMAHHDDRSYDGLGNHIYLEKQDKLRDIGIDIQTSQIVVVGNQSSGKSSLLESLTGFSFPRGQGLCTRYATQITLRRHPTSRKVVVSIIPRRNADPELNEKLRACRKEYSEFDGSELPKVMDIVNKTMGIRAGAANDDPNLPMFSDDILKIEISGPEQPHLTVIDVPGLFQVIDEGRTTQADRVMVENMVRRYMENERTIVLAVLPCTADRATETILEFAKAADPKGERTVGVLTKADNVIEDAVRQTLLGLVKGKTLKLGYYIVANRGADDNHLDIAACRAKEKALFSKPEWSQLAATRRTGVEALRSELQSLLTNLAKQELPKQRTEVAKLLEDAHKKLEAMGPARESPASQRECLTKLSSRFERITRSALEGRYNASPVFDEKPGLKLITRVVGMNEVFADAMWRRGHTRKFANANDSLWMFKEEDGNSDEPAMPNDAQTPAARSEEVLASIAESPELHDFFDYRTTDNPEPKDPIMDHIAECYRESRGPELGTFGGALLATTFREQTKKWPGMVHGHVAEVIAQVHSFIKTLLEAVFVDEGMREELWETVLLEKLLEAYRRAIGHADFLLNIELNGTAMTYNHYFNDNLQKAKLARVADRARCVGAITDHGIVIEPDRLESLAVNKSNADHVKEELHDILKSYYKVSRKRFVDVVCQQVVGYFLLEGEGSPLMILRPELITTMSDAQLDLIAGEDHGTRRERERLKTEIRGLEEAMRVLRG